MRFESVLWVVAIIALLYWATDTMKQGSIEHGKQIDWSQR